MAQMAARGAGSALVQRRAASSSTNSYLGELQTVHARACRTAGQSQCVPLPRAAPLPPPPPPPPLPLPVINAPPRLRGRPTHTPLTQAARCT